jgi:hypothetical protein
MIISLYGYLHSGFGAMHNKYHYPTGSFLYPEENTERETVGFIATGIAIRFK